MHAYALIPWFIMVCNMCMGFVPLPFNMATPPLVKSLRSSLEMGDAIAKLQALSAFLQKLRNDDEVIDIKETLEVIEGLYDYSPKPFSIGDEISNEAGQNEGSAKILSFVKLAGVEDLDITLRCFGSAYKDVLADPEGESHQNIRALMKLGLDAIEFPQGVALSPRQAQGDMPS
uniref:Uncharacterized protein n=1 Tax=Aureoumbra lagunensis TaxID=44058 RepID=A0A7S3JU34_9STRA|mmetsp:Transcript_19127/g.24815  ORF Transcript_19127/g.24815 Transcript_19127/m.24815 type:complete len:174 (+) Transcript_19127:19-540(+)